MRMLGRTATVLGLAFLAQTPSLRAQSIIGFDSFKWYIGGQAGLTIFETPAQTRGAIFTAGGNLLITARRTGLQIAIEEGIKKNQFSAYSDPSSPTGTRQVIFNDIRKYSFTLLAFPIKAAAQPYVGVGFGILETAKEYPQGTFVSKAEQEAADSTANARGSYGFGTLVGGIQFRVDRFALFGQYQITSSPPARKLFTGPTHSLMAGLRVSLGKAREDGPGGGESP
ncbi:MAG TPA: hypothetical protein VNH46_06845 [Gemmatimonadales bacterium]|nr:hypothetical protein [Gemmatimonadales bacterium]